MFQNTKSTLSEKAVIKVNFMESDIKKYFVASIMAGVYVGLAYFFTMVIGVAVREAVTGSFYKVAMGLSFALALNLIVFVGAELFTGNNMLMATGVLDKKVTPFHMIKLWGLCYIGNLVGSVLISIIYVLSGAGEGAIGEFMVNLTNTKSSYTPQVMFFRGILCNMIVCLGALAAYVMKEETGKLIMIFWCVSAFVTAGYEHSIANMSLFSTALMFDSNNLLSMGKLLTSFLWVTLGNIIGGAIIGMVYFYLGNDKK